MSAQLLMRVHDRNAIVREGAAARSLAPSLTEFLQIRG